MGLAQLRALLAVEGVFGPAELLSLEPPRTGVSHTGSPLSRRPSTGSGSKPTLAVSAIRSRGEALSGGAPTRPCQPGSPLPLEGWLLLQQPVENTDQPVRLEADVSWAAKLCSQRPADQAQAEALVGRFDRRRATNLSPCQLDPLTLLKDVPGNLYSPSRHRKRAALHSISGQFVAEGPIASSAGFTCVAGGG